MSKTTKQIELIFSDTAGKNFTLRVNDPNPMLVAEQVKDRRTEILEADVFRSQYGKLAGIVGARMVERAVSEFDILND